MRLTKLLGVLVLAVAFIPGAAFADDWYLGASVGSSNYGSKLVGGSMSTASGYDLLAGYRLSPHWALEAGYLDMGSVDYSNAFFGVDLNTFSQISVDTKGFALSMVGTIPFGDTWSGFVTVGAADSRTQVTTTSESVSPTLGTHSSSTSESASKVALDYGVGVQADTGGAWVFRLGWRRLNNVGKTDSTGTGDIDFVFVAALYSF